MSTQAIRTHWGRFWERWVVEISLRQVVVAALVLIGADTIYDQLGDSLSAGVFDEIAHVTTALLFLNLLPPRWRRPILPQALVASFLIDIDHVPQYLFHIYVLTEGTPRPYTHSLLTVAVCCAAALAWRRHRVLCVGIAVGLALHFVRDMAEGSGTGVSLLWPVTDRAFHYSHTLYLAIMAGVVGLNLLALTTQRVSVGLLACAALLAGCGAGAVKVAAQRPSANATSPADATPAGLFHRDCEVCHSLTITARPGQQGGSLHGLVLPASEVSEFVSEMPERHGPLTRTQVSELTRYLLAAADRRSGSPRRRTQDPR